MRGTVYEVQRSRDPRKLGSWKLYVGHLEAEFQVTASLVVFVPDPAVARWYRDQIALDIRSGARLYPRLFTAADVPFVADVEQAAVRPAPVLLAAICHLEDDGIDVMFPALLVALDALDTEMKTFYDDVTVGRLPEAARARWEAFLMTTALGRRYNNERYNEIDARGEARGEAKSVLLDLWLRRAANAATIEEVTRD